MNHAGRTTHFLHIGKTGGSALRHAFEPIAEQYRLRLHFHRSTLRDISDADGVVFFVRDPVTRFVSAFNSRLRKGQPRYNFPWSDGERVAFERFPTANRLAEALSSDDPAERDQAAAAIVAIQHLRFPLGRWLGDADYVQSRRKSILFIGFQESLDDDFEELKHRLGLPPDLALSRDPVVAHATPASFDSTLSTIAIANIREWCTDDVQLVDFLRTFRNTLG